MDIPAEATVRICIGQGFIYHCLLDRTNKDGTRYKKKRFFIVLNKNPKSDAIIVSVTITKQRDNQRAYIEKIGEDPGTLVAISRTDFPRLSVDSFVNCNNAYEKTLFDLIEDVRNGGKVFFEKLPKSIVDALVAGVMKSRQVPTEYKKLLV